MMQQESFPDLLQRLSTAHDRDISTLQTNVQRLEKENHELQSKLQMMSHAFSATMNMPSSSKPAANALDDYDGEVAKPPSKKLETYSPVSRQAACGGLTSDALKSLGSIASTKKAESQIRRAEGNVPDWCSVGSGSTARPPRGARASTLSLSFHFITEQVQQLIQHFDASGDGKLEYDEFLDACRPPMNLKRMCLVQKVFEFMDRDKSGSLTVDDIKQNFKPQNDPRVASRQMSDDQVAVLLDEFDVVDHSGQLSVEAFVRYYQGVSARIDDDAYFELMIRNAWHMSGGKGWSENTSCLRVLVTKSDGSQSVEEIKNDLGVDKSNYQDLLKRLNAQGMTDVVDIKLNM